jgi:hypothetical protein
MIQITKQMILDLIDLIDKHGLIHGAGERRTQFCVQQAVNRILHGDLYGQYSDSPDQDCVNSTVRGLGVRMNDHLREGISEKERGEALKRFAIAELGSSVIPTHQFVRFLSETLHLDEDGDMIDEFLSRRWESGQSRVEALKMFADTAANILRDLGTEGGKWLYLVDEPDKDKQIEGVCKLRKEMYAASLADFGVSSCTVKPQQHKH